MRVLIVEDKFVVALACETALHDAGFDCVGMATSAEEALQMAQRYRPDLVVLDVQLEGARTGIEAAIEIYDELSIRSLFVTAHADDETKARAARANPVGWLRKPFTDDEFIAAVRAAQV